MPESSDPAATPQRSVDRHSRRAAIAMAAALPTDIVIYRLLPMSSKDFDVTRPEAGLLLAANRLVRIAGYGWVARFYARRGAPVRAAVAGLTRV